ncbi:hypothetical protein M9Y10_023418 [Tritrichomonas musculus]|uniref:Protein kinase domain-containing protein n=1 Tax=Tritrichomonas musculus TaxID=1915356 RepID=A0ABR2KW42_9EUKA
MFQIKDYTSINPFRNSHHLMTGVKTGTNDHVFIKTREFDINEEAKITINLSDSLGFPHFFYYGIENNKSILITSQLGKSLKNLFYESNLKFSLKTLLMITDQLLQRLEFLFHSGIVHGRISPDHILVDRITTPNNPDTLYLINFEHSERIKINSEVGVKVQVNLICQDPLSLSSPNSTFEEILLSKAPYDTSRSAEDFLPTSVLCKEDLTPKSDLESLLYTLVYFFNRGKLPWSNEKSTIDHKVSILAEELCAGMPTEFTIFAKMIKALTPDDIPDYSQYRNLFRDLFIRKKYIYDGIFDWNKPRVISFSFNDRFNTNKGSSSNTNFYTNIPLQSSLDSFPKSLTLKSNPIFMKNPLNRPPFQFSQNNPQTNNDELQILNDNQENEIPITSDEILYPTNNIDRLNLSDTDLRSKHKHHHKHKHNHKFMRKQLPKVDFCDKDGKSDLAQVSGTKNKTRSSSLRIPQPPSASASSNQIFQTGLHSHTLSPSPSPSQLFDAFKTSSAPSPELHGFTYTMKQAQSAAQQYVSSLPRRGIPANRGRSLSLSTYSSSLDLS